MATTGSVRIWHDEEGWGILDSDSTPGGCWAHFPHIVGPGYRTLKPGQSVTFDWETAEQDGYSFRAIQAWRASVEFDAAPSPEPGPDAPMEETTSTYTSSMRIHFDS